MKLSKVSLLTVVQLFCSVWCALLLWNLQLTTLLQLSSSYYLCQPGKCEHFVIGGFCSIFRSIFFVIGGPEVELSKNAYRLKIYKLRVSFYRGICTRIFTV